MNEIVKIGLLAVLGGVVVALIQGVLRIEGPRSMWKATVYITVLMLWGALLGRIVRTAEPSGGIRREAYEIGTDEHAPHPSTVQCGTTGNDRAGTQDVSVAGL